jgi:hypothetical protein
VCSKQSGADTLSSLVVEVSCLAEVSGFESETMRMEMLSPNNAILLCFV